MNPDHNLLLEAAEVFKPKRGGKSQAVKFKAQKIALRKNRGKS